MFNNFICIMSAHLLSHNTIKSIMHMPSISTLKSYMNVNEAKTGWHDEIGEQFLYLYKICGHECIGFFHMTFLKYKKV
ncbi:2819_t:CDS:2 [Entrophospora sp. SA101]|nr:2819_t:CDS:2 [Entrophospora sp. SA101]